MAYGISLHPRELSATDIARLSGVGVSTVYRWAAALRDQEKREIEIERLRAEGQTQEEIANELGMSRSTVAEVVGDSHLRNSDKEPESEAQPEIESLQKAHSITSWQHPLGTPQ